MRFQILFCALLLAIICGCYCQEDATVEPDADVARIGVIPRFPTTTRSTTRATTTTTRSTTTTKKSPGWGDHVYEEDEDDYYGYGSSRYGDDDRYGDNKYGNDRYRGDKYDDDNYGNDNYDDKKYGNDDKYDDDYKPSESRSTRRKRYPDEYGNMNLYFREPSKTGRSKKLTKMRFPVHRFKKGHFPRFPPLLSFSPWLPIFCDRLTKQTIIFSPTGGVYIIPPVINFYGKLISVAQLIASGYASLVASGAPPPPAVNVAPLVQPGAVAGPGIPPLNPATGGFTGGVKTQLRSSPRPQYPRTVPEEGGYAPRKPNPGYGY